MRPRNVFLGLAAVAAGLGLVAGWRVATLTETQVIDAYAARYLDDARANGIASASERDCIAYPVDWDGGTGWLAVRCGLDAFSVTYTVNRLGILIAEERSLSAQGR